MQRMNGVSVGVIVGMVVLVGLGDSVSVGDGVTVGADVKVGAARKLFSFSRDEHALITNNIPEIILVIGLHSFSRYSKFYRFHTYAPANSVWVPIVCCLYRMSPNIITHKRGLLSGILLSSEK